MGTLGAEFGGFHHGRKERTEDGTRDGRPAELAGVDQRRPQRRVEIGKGEPFREQTAVDVGKAGQVIDCMRANGFAYSSSIDPLRQTRGLPVSASTAPVRSGGLFLSATARSSCS